MNTFGSDAYWFRGRAYEIMGQHQRAIQDFDKVIELDPEYYLAYVNRGRLSSEEGDIIRQSEKPLNWEPHCPDLFDQKVSHYR